MQFLTFQLYAPMASTGTVGGIGEWRTEMLPFPSRSQLTGLIGCCLGVDREHLGELSGLRFAVRVVHSGSVMIDFHTVQGLREGKHQGHVRTRRDEVAEAIRQNRTTGKHIPTITGRRTYLNDAAFVVTVWDGDLERIAHALEFPKWTPYFGRKSCPLGLPMAPELGEFDDPAEACRAYEFGRGLDGLPDGRDDETVWIAVTDAAEFSIPCTGRTQIQQRTRARQGSGMSTATTVFDQAADVLNVPQAVAELTRQGRPISDRRLRQLCASGRVEGARQLNRQWLIPAASLESLAADVRRPGRPAKQEDENA